MDLDSQKSRSGQLKEQPLSLSSSTIILSVFIHMHAYIHIYMYICVSDEKRHICLSSFAVNAALDAAFEVV